MPLGVPPPSVVLLGGTHADSAEEAAEARALLGLCLLAALEGGRLPSGARHVDRVVAVGLGAGGLLEVGHEELEALRRHRGPARDALLGEVAVLEAGCGLLDSCRTLT